MTEYRIVYEKSKDGYSAYVPDLPGCKRLQLENINQEKNLNKDERSKGHIDKVYQK
tara:strand:+ start:583 stop:750 length:168 start_codon:yes stop_codon:yes gene_type:complete